MTWVLSVSTILNMWLMGNKTIAGPISGLGSQVLWGIYTVNTRQWGLLLSVVVLCAVHVRNLRRWLNS
jgi:hypothetical protein